MIYRGYWIERIKADGYNDSGDIVINGERWAVMFLKRIVFIGQTLKEAKDYVEEQTKGVLYRPQRHRIHRKTEFEEFKKAMEDKRHD